MGVAARFSLHQTDRSPSGASHFQHMKLSKYIISTPVSGVDGTKWLLFSTRTGAIGMMNQSDWRNLLSGEISGLHLKNLHSAGLLVDDGFDELEEILTQNDTASQKVPVLYQVIMPSSSCQLACNEGSCGAYCGQTHSTHTLSPEAQNQVVERVRKKLSAKTFHSLEVGWFGGEPLLGMSAIRRLSPLLRDAALSFGCQYHARMVTNGLKLMPALARELVLEHLVQSFEITLDGDAEHHNQRRCTKNRHLPTFEQILANIRALANDCDLSNCKIKIRCNVDSRNKAGVLPLLRRLREAELQGRITFYMAPVHPWGNDVRSLALSASEYGEFEISIFRELFDLGFDCNLIPKRKQITCTATNKHASVLDPFGNYHVCTETPLVRTYEERSTHGKSSLKILDSAVTTSDSNRYVVVTATGKRKESFAAEKLRLFTDQVREQNYLCHECVMLPVCGGSCPLNWQLGHVPCPSAKQNIKARLQLWYERRSSLMIDKQQGDPMAQLDC